MPNDMVKLRAAQSDGRESAKAQYLIVSAKYDDHVITATPDVAMYERDGVLYLKLQAETEVKHEEHARVTLPIGTYRVARQREYTPEAIRNVAD